MADSRSRQIAVRLLLTFPTDDSMSRLVLISLLVVSIGCAKSRPKESVSSLAIAPPTAKIAPPTSKSVSHIGDSLDRLLNVPVSETSTPISLLNSLEQLEIPTAESVASDGRRHALLLDHRTGLVWVSTSGGIGGHLNKIAGPWTMDNPNVIRLRDVIANHVASLHESPR